MADTFSLLIDTPEPGILLLELRSPAGTVRNARKMAYSGPVDNLLLTSVDNLLKESNVDRFALIAVDLGQGIDKGSSLYRIAQSVAAAIAAAR